MSRLTILAACAVLSGLQSRAAPSIPPEQPNRYTSLEGQVLDQSDTVLAGATVDLIDCRTERVWRSIQTDPSGIFAFFDVAPGTYSLTATRPPYLASTYGSRRAKSPGTPIEVVAGESVRGLIIRMARGSTIAGVIRLPDGDTFGGAVELLQRTISTSARVSWSVVASALTDDRGAYRIVGVWDGDFLVRVVPPAGNQISPSSDAFAKNRLESRPYGYAVTYHPHATLESAAILVSFNGESHVENVDVVVQIVPLARIDGKVTTGVPDASLTAGDVTLQLMGRASPPMVTPISGNRFSFTGVGPGDYVVQARAMIKTDQVQSSELVATRFVSVAGADVSDLNLALVPPQMTRGRLVFLGDTTSSMAAFHVSLRPNAPSRAARSSQSARVAPDGTFAIPVWSTGRYTVEADADRTEAADEPVWAVTSVAFGDQMLISSELDVREDITKQEIVITLTKSLGTVSGTVLDSGDHPRPEYTVILFPQDKSLWSSGRRRIFAIRPNQSGRFQAAGVQPGPYHIAPIENPEPNAWFVPSLLESLVTRSTPLVVRAESATVVQLVVK